MLRVYITIYIYIYIYILLGRSAKLVGHRMLWPCWAPKKRRWNERNSITNIVTDAWHKVIDIKSVARLTGNQDKVLQWWETCNIQLLFTYYSHNIHNIYRVVHGCIPKSYYSYMCNKSLYSQKVLICYTKTPLV